MNWTYDFTADAMYVTIRKTGIDRQEVLAHGTVVDINDEGLASGVEIIGVKGWNPGPLYRSGLVPDEVTQMVQFLISHLAAVAALPGELRSAELSGVIP